MKKSKYEKILSLAPKLIAKEGYDGTSFQEIANEVGLHKSSLFHYFKNKEELLLKILQKPIDEVNSNLRKIINNKKFIKKESIDIFGKKKKICKGLHGNSKRNESKGIFRWVEHKDCDFRPVGHAKLDC
jgi:AcrR family transcriptional regulator